jgi:hypothetical protein
MARRLQWERLQAAASSSVGSGTVPIGSQTRQSLLLPLQGPSGIARQAPPWPRGQIASVIPKPDVKKRALPYSSAVEQQGKRRKRGNKDGQLAGAAPAGQRALKGGLTLCEVRTVKATTRKGYNHYLQRFHQWVAREGRSLSVTKLEATVIDYLDVMLENG